MAQALENEPATADLNQLASQLQQLNPSDLQALQNKLAPGQNTTDIAALLRSAQNQPPTTVFQLPGGLQGVLNGKALEALLKEAAKAKDDHLSLQLTRPEDQYKIPTVGNPVLPTLPTQPGVALPGAGGTRLPAQRCNLPPYCKHVTIPGPLCKCPEEDEDRSGGRPQ